MGILLMGGRKVGRREGADEGNEWRERKGRRERPPTRLLLKTGLST